MYINTLSKAIFLGLSFASLSLAQGTQFITGPCNSDSDCASQCCGFNSGKCAGPVIAQTRDGGCGHGDAQPNDRAAQAFFASQNAASGAAPATAAANPPAAASTASSGSSGSSTGSNPPIDSSIPGSANVGLGNGAQFITGQCFSDADCASGCCGFNTGKCAGAIIAQTRDGGCGFGSGTPNDNAAQALTGGASTTPATGSTGSSSSSSGSGSSSSSSSSSSGNTGGTIDTSIPGSANVGKANGSQFITGQCFSDADCASGCCGFNTGKCAGAIIAQTRDGGCGFGDAQPNDTAAKALTGGAKKRRSEVREYMA